MWVNVFSHLTKDLAFPTLFHQPRKDEKKKKQKKNPKQKHAKLDSLTPSKKRSSYVFHFLTVTKAKSIAWFLITHRATIRKLNLSVFRKNLSAGTDRLNSSMLDYCHRTRHLRCQTIASFSRNGSALLLIFRLTFKECRSKVNLFFCFLRAASSSTTWQWFLILPSLPPPTHPQFWSITIKQQEELVHCLTASTNRHRMLLCWSCSCIVRTKIATFTAVYLI